MMAVRRQVGQVILHGRISCGVGTICAICRKIVQPKMPPALERFGLAGRGETLEIAASLEETERGEQMRRQAFVRWALSQVSERERFVLEQYYFEERTVQEIAKILGISHQAVCKIKKQAIEKLRKLLS
ncbi:MAG: hypothetical protein C4295_12600 [Candidatus Fervidibacterota bacterium]